MEIADQARVANRVFPILSSPGLSPCRRHSTLSNTFARFEYLKYFIVTRICLMVYATYRKHWIIILYNVSYQCKVVQCSNILPSIVEMVLWVRKVESMRQACTYYFASSSHISGIVG